MSGIFVKACPNADGGIILLVVEEHLATRLLHAFVFEVWGRDFVRGGQPFLPELAMLWHIGDGPCCLGDELSCSFPPFDRR